MMKRKEGKEKTFIENALKDVMPDSHIGPKGSL